MFSGKLHEFAYVKYLKLIQGNHTGDICLFFLQFCVGVVFVYSFPCYQQYFYLRQEEFKGFSGGETQGSGGLRRKGRKRRRKVAKNH